MKAEVAVACSNHLGEGAFWHPRMKKLFWVDIPPPSELIAYDLAADSIQYHGMPQMITAVRPWGNDLIIAAHNGVHKYDLQAKQLARVIDPEPLKPFNRCNDGGTDANGRFWFGTMQNNISPGATDIELVQASGSLYRLDPDLKLTMFESDIRVSNTLCFSPTNDTMYFCDTPADVIWAYDYDLATGTPSNRRDFAKFDRGHPDGSCVDAEGGLWNARWDGGCVVRFDPNGKPDAVIEVPASRVTSVAFGGENLDKLFITTARWGLSECDLDGHLFVAEPGVRGLPTYDFG